METKELDKKECSEYLSKMKDLAKQMYDLTNNQKGKSDASIILIVCNVDEEREDVENIFSMVGDRASVAASVLTTIEKDKDFRRMFRECAMVDMLGSLPSDKPKVETAAENLARLGLSQKTKGDC